MEDKQCPIGFSYRGQRLFIIEFGLKSCQDYSRPLCIYFFACMPLAVHLLCVAKPGTASVYSLIVQQTVGGAEFYISGFPELRGRRWRGAAIHAVMVHCSIWQPCKQTDRQTDRQTDMCTLSHSQLVVREASARTMLSLGCTRGQDIMDVAPPPPNSHQMLVNSPAHVPAINSR
jgi:hypothetical protein